MTVKPYWTSEGKAKNLASLTSIERLQMLETLRQTEAKEWQMRYAKKSVELGTVRARSWWNDIKADIERRRGKAGLLTLTNEMNRQRHEKPISNH